MNQPTSEIVLVPSEKVSSSSARVFSDLLQLTKPTISLLVVVTVIPGILIGSVNQELPSAAFIMICLLGTWLASASASIFNHLVDQDIDQKMNRTARRPIASGRIDQKVAGTFAVVLGVMSFVILSYFANIQTAMIGLIANAFYVLVYTMYLKRRTIQNIVIGGAAGAVGPLMGYAAVTGTLDMSSWLLFFLIFMWTPPHFWALALKYTKDYKEAGIPMYPVVKGDRATRHAMFYYSLFLPVITAGLAFFAHVGWFYLVSSAVFSLYFLWLSWRLKKEDTNRLAMPLFHYSCLYLFLIFGVLTLDLMIERFFI